MSKVTLTKTQLKELERKLGNLNRLNVKVGILQSKGGAAEHNNDGITMAELGTIHEFGAPKRGIPERSFIRSTFKDPEVQREVQGQFADIAKDILKNLKTMDLRRPLGKIGVWAVAEVRDRVYGKDIKQDLAPATIKRKTRTNVDGQSGAGSTVALVDTGRLMQSLNYELEND